jgi:hypothetical protein
MSCKETSRGSKNKYNNIKGTFVGTYDTITCKMMELILQCRSIKGVCSKLNSLSIRPI